MYNVLPFRSIQEITETYRLLLINRVNIIQHFEVQLNVRANVHLVAVWKFAKFSATNLLERRISNPLY